MRRLIKVVWLLGAEYYNCNLFQRRNFASWLTTSHHQDDHVREVVRILSLPESDVANLSVDYSTEA
jgi:hypothetical protein